MIRLIIELLSMNDFQGVSDNIEIAKGRHKLYTNFKDIAKQAKRETQWQKSLKK